MQVQSVRAATRPGRQQPPEAHDPRRPIPVRAPYRRPAARTYAAGQMVTLVSADDLYRVVAPLDDDAYRIEPMRPRKGHCTPFDVLGLSLRRPGEVA